MGKRDGDNPTAQDALTEALYAAGLGEQGWDVPLHALRQLTGVRLVNLLEYGPNDPGPTVTACAADELPWLMEWGGRYASEFHRHDPAPAAVARFGVGRWFRDTEAFSAAHRARHVFYQEFMRPSGQGAWSGLFVQRSPEHFAFLSLITVDGAAFTPAHQARADAAARHLGRALRVRQSLGDADRRGAIAANMLDALDLPLFLCDDTGRLLLRNHAAAALSEQVPALRFVQGRFVPRPGWQEAHWRAAVAQGALMLQRPDGVPVQLFFNPVPAHTTLAQTWQRPLVLMTAPGPSSPALRRRRLQALYGLTYAEAEIATLIACEGLSPQECADAKHVSLSTVRSQVNAIRAKLDAPRMSVVVTRVLAL